MKYFCHNLAEVQSTQIGINTSIWQFVVILKEATIGSRCNICAHVFIENEVSIGDDVTIKSGVQLWDGITLEDHVFIGPNVTFTNDLLPRSKKYPVAFEKTLIKQGASIGANATILAGNEIGEFAMLGAGSVLTKSMNNNELWVGNPAKHIGYVTNEGVVLDLNLICKETEVQYEWFNNELILNND
ncbi:acyltransferase [Aureibaculum luteum]|uniref:acyltransferase n=1 Tax=Aureibaculum luteum TaxID=1548456 RepID=UPI000E519053|nr:acyltransferase [Aureibaculum luteum]